MEMNKVEEAINPKIYKIRDLQYALPRLLLVCTMMLLATQTLGLVCYNLVPGVKPILLDRVGASATDIALVIGTIPQAINFILCPIISTLSDRTRTRIGRRIPYLIFSAPVLVVLLLMIAWTPEIAELVNRFLPFTQGGNTAFWVLAVLILLFQVTYLFPGSVVYYLIADVIPKECVGRFMAASMVVSSVRRSADYLAMFFRQCFQHRIFVLLFLCTGLNQASNICRGMYNVLFATKDIGMTIGTYGKIIGGGAAISAVVVLFMGRIMDKTHPMFIYLIGGCFIMLVNVFGYFFIYSTMTFAVIGIATAIMYALQGLAFSPLLINLLPPDKYGQFSSANSMVNSVAVFFGAWLGGQLTDIFGYRVMFVWDFGVTLLATLALIGVYREWKRFGGKAGYTPPPIH